MTHRIRIIIMVAAAVEVEVAIESAEAEIIEIESVAAPSSEPATHDAEPVTVRSPPAPRTLRGLGEVPHG